MSFRYRQTRRLQEARERRRAVRRRRILASGSLIVVLGVVGTIVIGSASTSHSGGPRSTASTKPSARTRSTSAAGGEPGTASAPILTYHVINVEPAQSGASPALYVSTDEFSSQMLALKDEGWHAVTLDQLEAYWTRGTSLGAGKPFVITFDGGYASQYTNAMPVLRRLGWVGVEDLAVAGLPPAQGGLADAQIRGMITAGWELDTEGMTGADLTTLSSDQLRHEVAIARQLLRSRYGVPVNWFSYPLGHYDATVIDAVRSAGFVGSTTVISGWASAPQDRFRLPRLQVVSGTSPSQLLSQVAAAQVSPDIPSTYSGGPSP